MCLAISIVIQKTLKNLGGKNLYYIKLFNTKEFDIQTSFYKKWQQNCVNSTALYKPPNPAMLRIEEHFYQIAARK